MSTTITHERMTLAEFAASIGQQRDAVYARWRRGTLEVESSQAGDRGQIWVPLRNGLPIPRGTSGKPMTVADLAQVNGDLELAVAGDGRIHLVIPTTKA